MTIQIAPHLLILFGTISVLSAAPNDDARNAKFIEYWIGTSLEENLIWVAHAEKEDNEELVTLRVTRFYHQAFYYWLATRGPSKWIEPVPHIDKLIRGIAGNKPFSKRLAKNLDPAELAEIPPDEAGNPKSSILRHKEDTWMPGIKLSSIKDPAVYRQLVLRFRKDLIQSQKKKIGEQDEEPDAG